MIVIKRGERRYLGFGLTFGAGVVAGGIMFSLVSCSNVGNQVDMSSRITNTTLRYYQAHDESIRAKSEVALAEIKLLADLSEKNDVDVDHIIDIAKESISGYQPAAPPGFSFPGNTDRKNVDNDSYTENKQSGSDGDANSISQMENLPALKELADNKKKVKE